MFTSKSDQDKHVKFVHGGVRTMRQGEANADEGNKVGREHKCPVCNQKYPTRYQLLKHQDNESHKLKRGRPGNS